MWPSGPHQQAFLMTLLCMARALVMISGHLDIKSAGKLKVRYVGCMCMCACAGITHVYDLPKRDQKTPVQVNAMVDS